jgi:CTD kinase subunit alpha
LPRFRKPIPLPDQKLTVRPRLQNLDGDWHELESKALRRENERKEKEAKRAAAKGAGMAFANSVIPPEKLREINRDKKRPSETAAEPQRDAKRPHVDPPGPEKAPAAAPAKG